MMAGRNNEEVMIMGVLPVHSRKLREEGKGIAKEKAYSSDNRHSLPGAGAVLGSFSRRRREPVPAGGRDHHRGV